MAMVIEGEERISASRGRVWAALNDPEVLRQCIPGCQALEMQSPQEMSAVVTVGIGPIKAKFHGDVTLSEINAPISYKIQGEGKGGVAGFAKGGARVELQEMDDGTTLLAYSAQADVGGKLAQLGGRLIMSTSKKLTGEFFSNLNRVISAA